MGDKSAIEWTDATWNPITGCSKVSPGCAHCYAERFSLTRLRGKPGYTGLPWTPANAAANVLLRPERLDQPLRWRRPRRIFVNSLSDLFHEQVPDEFVDHVFAVMALAPQHTFQVLTKRPERMRDYATQALGRIADTVVRLRRERGEKVVEVPLAHVPLGHAWWPLPNVWLGTSIENARWNVRANALRETPAAVRFISAEPLLGPLVEQSSCRICAGDGWYVHQTGDDQGEQVQCRECQGAGVRWLGLDLAGIDWIIVGGESGPGARPMHSDWARTLRDYARDRGVAFLFKQWGEWQRGSDFEDDAMVMARDGRVVRPEDVEASFSRSLAPALGLEMIRRVGKGRAGRELDGRTWDEYPEVRAW